MNRNSWVQWFWRVCRLIVACPKLGLSVFLVSLKKRLFYTFIIQFPRAVRSKIYMEEKILLQHCQEYPALEAAKYISLVDKDEIARDDLTWEEIEPYIRIFGVTTQNLLSQGPAPKQDLHKIEGRILSQHERLSKILKTTDLLGSTQKLVENCEEIEKKLKGLEEKQQKCCEKTIGYLNEIYEKLQQIGGNKEEKGPYYELNLRIRKIKLKANCLKNFVNKEIYNERSAKALGVIRDELESTYDEYNDIRVMLNERISMYENNDSIKGLLKKYSVLKQRISKRKQDILSISK